MNRTAKLAGQWVLVAALMCASAWMGARVATGTVQGMHKQPGLILTDGGTKPPGSCC